MIKVQVRDDEFEIRPISQDELVAVLNIYRQCEDFLALGPVATASEEMVRKDFEISAEEGGIFCGIYKANGEMIGIIDYVPHFYKRNPAHAYLELLMIAAPYRKHGLGKAVVEAIEEEIRKDASVMVIFSGVQVNNPQAIRFWLRNGYRIVSEPKRYPDQTTAVDLRKDILPEAAA